MNRSEASNLEKLGSLVGVDSSEFVESGDCYPVSILRLLEHHMPHLHPANQVNRSLVYQWVEQITLWCTECQDESEILNKLEAQLARRTYMVGHEKTMADLIVFVFISEYFKRNVAPSDQHTKFCNVYRWLKFISSQY